MNCIAHELLEKLKTEDETTTQPILNTWHPEWGAWMIEATPRLPYGKNTHDLLKLEESLSFRRARIQNMLPPGSGLCSLPAWPRMGTPGFVDGFEQVQGDKSTSNYLPDFIINPHPRFGTLVQNIRRRRGKKVEIHVPVFIDEKTNLKLINDSLSTLPNFKEIEDKSEIYMDAMGFGMGCCCLQVTFQGRDLKESRYLYDQLSVLCPIFLSLSAGSPIFKGFLANTDVRWNVISQSVDCRTPKERGLVGLDTQNKQRGRMRIRKSRYSSVNLYISDSPLLKNKIQFYNDLETEMNQETYDTLINNGVDDILSRHIAHLFIRDPLVVFSDRIYVDDNLTTEHFENIQSTNWNSMRFKLPPVADTGKDAIGWRVEFRPMEAQLTDFENSAYTIAVVLLSRVILFFNLNLYIPISKVDANMETAHEKDSILNRKFYFRKNLVPLESDCKENTPSVLNTVSVEDEFELMTISEILLGKGDEFPGLFPLIYAYLDIIDCDEKIYDTINNYLKFLSSRAEGKVKTLARWTRDFVQNHPDYKKDSIINQKIEFDLVQKANDISNLRCIEPDLLGSRRSNSFTFGEAESIRQRLRGASFSEDFNSLQSSRKQSECQVITDLVKKYSNKMSEYIISEATGFAATPAFLSS